MSVKISKVSHGRLPEGEEFDELRDLFAAHAPAGYTIVLNYTRAGPEYVESHYDPEWQAQYDAHHYYWRDPVLLWAMARNGNQRWSNMPFPDIGGVMKKARRFGMIFGGAFARDTSYGKSLLSVARDDRELTDEEMLELASALDRLIDLVGDSGLTDRELDVLRCLSRDMTLEQAAQHLGISVGAVKLRLSAARKRLDVQTTYGAIREVVMRKLL